MNEIELVERLSYLNKMYYNNSTSVVTDNEYDELKALYERKNGKFEVGSFPDSFLQKVKHNHYMLSLQKVNTIEDILKWCRLKNIDEKDLIVEYKLDGVSVSLIYKRGILIKAISRGNGDYGEDITNNIYRIKSIPKYHPYLQRQEYIEIRGEILISKDNFEKMKLEDDKFVSARNTASGAVRLKDSNLINKRNLDFLAYYVFNKDNLVNDIIEQREILKNLNFSIPKAKIRFSLEERINKFDIERKDYKYQVDGLVIKINSLDVIKELGNSSNYPKWAIAYKFKSEEAETILKGIEWQVSSTGRINPVAILEPVEIAGVTISKASLHNLEYIENLGITKGCKIKILRANDVIPYVKEVLEFTKEEMILPTKCPCCNSLLKKDKMFLICENNNCRDKIKNEIINFTKILEIKGIGNKIAENIANYFYTNNKGNKILTYCNILNFSENDFINFTNSEVLAKKIKKELDLALEKFTSTKALACLFIDGISLGVAEKIISNIDYNDLEATSINKFQSIDGIGEVIAKNLYNNISIENNKIYHIYNYFKKFIKEEVKITYSDKLKDKKICITGSFDIKRNEIEQLIKLNNGTFIDSVSKNLDYLILGDNAGSKLAKAQKLNIKIISLENFMKMII